MPRPQPKLITFTIDGREVQAPEGTMLVDAAKLGDVEIPVFCYEPKLVNPVGACRMCLVEIEGIPKLQTGCSTPVKDGMVVNTETDRVKEAQNAVVEFLLINHPLDCPVCDKGGECPLQDVTFGWGRGISRFIEPKRHFKKPLELSPLVAIDRERCILCYRCVRFSQETSEDHQLVLLERGASSFVGTFDGHPYVAPFSGNIVELCPVGALTSIPYRFRARPWDVEQAGSVCTLCPSQCNTSLTVRDEKVMRVLARDNEDVDDGWLCDKGRFAYQSFHVDERITQPLVREGADLRPVSWERALEAAASGLSKAKGRTAALAGDGTTNEEGYLLARLLREGLDSPHLDSRPGGALAPGLRRALDAPDLAATVSDLEYAHAVLLVDFEPVDDAPILDLRIRKGVRHRGVRLAVASSRPSALDPSAAVSLRFAPGGGAGALAELAAALDGGDVSGDARALAGVLRTGEEVVVAYGERLLHGPRGEDAARGLLALAERLGLRGRAGGGLLEIPAAANGRGLREAGVLPNAGPGLSDVATPGLDAPGIARALGEGELSAVVLANVDPVRSYPDPAAWNRALARATTVIAFDTHLSPSLTAHATVVFPGESYAEKEGTVTHPDGRVQRLRPAIRRVGETRAGWQVLGDLAKRLGLDFGVLHGAMASRQLFAAVPFYDGITLEELGGRGLRWQERDAAAQAPAGEAGPFAAPAAAGAGASDGLRVGTYRSIWASKEVEASPSLRFLAATQQVELSPQDAQRLGVGDGEEVELAANGTRLRGTARLRAAVPAGTVFVAAGLPDGGGSALTEETVEVRPA